jgi:hypothetical protein
MILPFPPYVMLMASLPAIGRVLTDQAPPISEARLAERLKALLPEDREELERIREVVSWHRLDRHEETAAFVARANALLASIRGEPVRTAVRDRLEIRTLLAALRRRHAGAEAPARGEAWGVGRYLETIRAHWSAPDLGVGRLFPWVAAAKQKLDAGDRIGLERIVLEAAWAAGERHLALHAFDYEAVVYYVLRWSLVDRWSRYDAEAAAERFAELLEEALADFAELRNAA